MLDLAKCTIVESNLSPVASTVITLEEGTALVAAYEDGLLVVKPSEGVSGEVFLGVANTRFTRPNFANAVIETSVPGSAPYTVRLSKVPVSVNDVIVYIAGSKAVRGIVATGVYSISGNTLTFHASDAGKDLRILSRYALTQAEAAMLFGSDIVDIDLSSGVNVSRINTGTVYTDNFVVEDDWSDPEAEIFLGADGKFTTQSGGTRVDGIVAETPFSAGGFLGLLLHP